MTETNELNTALTDFVARMTEYADSAEGFAAEQAPLVVEELLAWGLTSNTLGACLALVAVVICLSVVVWAIKNDLDDPGLFGAVLLGLLFAGFSLVCLGVCLFEVIKITVAPRVWLIEYASNLIN